MMRRTKNILILTGELMVVSFSPISKYDRAIRENVMVDARAKAPFISILSFFVNKNKVYCFLS
jgi:hypothetical protein